MKETENISEIRSKRREWDPSRCIIFGNEWTTKDWIEDLLRAYRDLGHGRGVFYRRTITEAASTKLDQWKENLFHIFPLAREKNNLRIF
jgi:hypothetical protein